MAGKHPPDTASQPLSTIPLIVILGPTAVGKTEISIQLAEHLNGEIISADSRLFYRGMDIGTAKPSAAERARVPHHLIDVAEVDETWSLADFQREAQRVIADIHARRHLPFLVGGSGQYIRAICQGWTPPELPPHPALRAILSDWGRRIGAENLHARLGIIDPKAMQTIQPNNLRRTVRALEVIFTTGRRFSEQRGCRQSPYRLLLLGLHRPRAELYARIDARIHDMLKAGFVEEVQHLLARGYSPDLPSLSAIGYRQIIDYLQGRLSLEEAISQIKRLTRQFVRRQANWFKPDDPQIHWFTVGPYTLDDMEKTIKEFL